MNRSIAIIVAAGLVLWALTAFSGPAPRKEKHVRYNILNKQEQHVILHKGTERPGTGKYEHNKKPGTYLCRQCNAPLYKARGDHLQELRRASGACFRGRGVHGEEYAALRQFGELAVHSRGGGVA